MPNRLDHFSDGHRPVDDFRDLGAQWLMVAGWLQRPMAETAVEPSS